VSRLFDAIAELLHHLASQRLVLVALEDVHWADAMSLNLLSFVARRISGWPVMVVATARDEELTVNATQILRALDVEERLDFCAGGSPFDRDAHARPGPGRSGASPGHRTQRLTGSGRSGEGNPFMVVETTQVAQ
jgi:hypothetical protein